MRCKVSEPDEGSHRRRTAAPAPAATTRQLATAGRRRHANLPGRNTRFGLRTLAHPGATRPARARRRLIGRTRIAARDWPARKHGAATALREYRGQGQPGASDGACRRSSRIASCSKSSAMRRRASQIAGLAAFSANSRYHAASSRSFCGLSIAPCPALPVLAMNAGNRAAFRPCTGFRQIKRRRRRSRVRATMAG
jgi:hypothetical protein